MQPPFNNFNDIHFPQCAKVCLSERHVFDPCIIQGNFTNACNQTSLAEMNYINQCNNNIFFFLYLSQDEMKDLQQKVTTKIDMGNA